MSYKTKYFHSGENVRTFASSIRTTTEMTSDLCLWRKSNASGKQASELDIFLSAQAIFDLLIHHLHEGMQR